MANIPLTPPAKFVHDLDLGPAVELPLSAIAVTYNGYTVLAPLPVYQCPECYSVLPHKFDVTTRTLRIAVCQLHRQGGQSDKAT